MPPWPPSLLLLLPTPTTVTALGMVTELGMVTPLGMVTAAQLTTRVRPLRL